MSHPEPASVVTYTLHVGGGVATITSTLVTFPTLWGIVYVIVVNSQRLFSVVVMVVKALLGVVDITAELWVHVSTGVETIMSTDTVVMESVPTNVVVVVPVDALQFVASVVVEKVVNDVKHETGGVKILVTTLTLPVPEITVVEEITTVEIEHSEFSVVTAVVVNRV